MRAHMLKCLVATLLIGTLCVSQAAPALAQSTETQGDRLKGNVAGTVGLGVLGAEVGLFLPPAFNLQDRWWAWVLFPAITAAGGAIAGAFAFEPRNPNPAVTISILGASFLLAVPAVVGASAFSTYRRDRDIERAESGGLLRFGKRGPQIGAPNISTVAVFTPTEQARYGLPQKTSTRLTLVSGHF